jgi:lipopolysaccharide/colanic/teichoic acid biosynthesis glycosyltransferase
MSLVGPRPEVLDEVVLYTADQKRVLEVQPGITDWASIKFRDEDEVLRGSKDPHRDYHILIRPEKMRLALEYVDHRSFWTDIKILWFTAKVVLCPPPVPPKPAINPSKAGINDVSYAQEQTRD